MPKLPDTHRDPNSLFGTQTRAEKTQKNVIGPIRRLKIKHTEAQRQKMNVRKRMRMRQETLTILSGTSVVPVGREGSQSSFPTPIPGSPYN